MDGVVIIILTVVLYLIYLPEKSKKVDENTTSEITIVHIVKNPMLNPEMKHDERAFMKIAYELGFR